MNNSKTTIGTIMTGIGLVPQAVATLGLTEVPDWLRVAGMACAFISFIWTGLNTQDAQK